MSTRSGLTNFWAGVFVLLGISGFVFSALLLAGLRELLTPKNDYVIRFTLTDGVEGLTEGSAVKVGGITRGRVTSIQTMPDPNVPGGMEIITGVRIDSAVPLRTDAVPYLQRPLLGGSGWINFTSLGSAPDLLAPEGVLLGQLAPPSILAEAGFGPEQREQVQEILKSFRNIASSGESITRRADEVFAAFQQDLGSFTRTLQDAADDVRRATSSTADKVPQWQAQVDTFMASANDAGRRLNSALDDARGFIGSLQREVDEAREGIRAFVRNAEQLSDKLNTDAYRQLTDALAKLDRGLDSAADTADRARAIFRDNDQTLRETLANLRLASDQLQLTLVEVRRAPWRLLYQPGKRELEQELLFDAARRYAEAAGDLNRAVQTLAQMQTAAARPPDDRTPDEQRFVEAWSRRVRESLDRYSQAETAFLRLLGVPVDGASPGRADPAARP